MHIPGNLVPATIASSDGAFRSLRNSCLFCISVALVSLVFALTLPKGYALAFIGDSLQVGLVSTAAVLSFRNALHSRSHVRGFWLMIFLGTVMWTVSLLLWSVYELWFRSEVPDIPIADILLFVKLVPLTAAIALEPHRNFKSRFRAFGLLDVSILTLYSLYLYAFCVFAYRLLPGAVSIYNFHFDLADTIGNQLFALVAAFALLRIRGPWKNLYRIYFLAAAGYCFASDFDNAAIDLGRYYSGSLLDVPLTLSLAALVIFTWEGRRLLASPPLPNDALEPSAEPESGLSFVSSHLAMIVTLSVPAIGLWLVTRTSSSPIFSFRLNITLLTMFLLTMLLSVKQHLLTETLVGSLQNLSETYARVNRFKDQLTQNEKLASLGGSVAQVAKQIKQAMRVIQERSHLITVQPHSESRIHAMAGKIDQYAQRTDVLVENMLRFAQETPLQLAPLEIKPLLESTLQLGRVSKVVNVVVGLTQVGEIPLVLGDSSQLLHVFLQIISNAIDALKEVGGGSLDVLITAFGNQVSIEFSDTGAGIKEPEHVFEPFYTTKAVGKGVGLGLSTCYGIIQKHQGEIACRNRPQGGAVFTVLLPSEQLSQSVEPEASAAMLGGAR